jgi:hypothetical protein
MLIMIGLTAEAQAVTSGSYRCVAFQGPVTSTIIIPFIVQYNPNATGVQSIRRIRIFDSGGTLLSDQSFVPGAQPVAARGARIVISAATASQEALQFIVNWSQTVDAAAPIPRLELYNNAAGVFTVAGQSNCP